MRTTALIGFSFACILVIALLWEATLVISMVAIAHIVCLVTLSRNVDMQAFVQEHTNRAQLLEICLYATAFAWVTLYVNGAFWFAPLAACFYAVCWHVMVNASPPYAFYTDELLFEDLPEDADGNFLDER
jgi:hypothetical protein